MIPHDILKPRGARWLLCAAAILTAASLTPGAGASAQFPKAQTIDLTAEPTSSTTVKLRWRINHPGVIGGIQIHRARPVAPANYALLVTLPATTSTYMDTGLEPGGFCIYRIQTSGKAGQVSTSSKSVWVRLPAAPAPVAAPLTTGALSPNRPRPGIPFQIQDFSYGNAIPLDALEEELLYQLNQHRAASGRGPVRPSIALSLASNSFGKELAGSGVFATTSAIARNTMARARAVGFRVETKFDSVVATAKADPVALLETLKASPFDNPILLDPAWKVVGISRNYSEKDGAYRWVLDFAGWWDVTIPLPGEDTDGRIDGNEQVRTRPPSDALAANASFTGYGDDGKPYSPIHCNPRTGECWKDPVMNLGRSLREISLPEHMIGEWHVGYQFTEKGAWHFNDAGRYDMTEFQMSLKLNQDGTWVSQGYRAFRLPPPAQAGTWTWVHDAGRNEEVVTFHRDGRPTAVIRVHAAHGEMTFFAVEGGAEMRNFFRGAPADANKANDPQVVFKPGLLSFAEPFPMALRCMTCPLPVAGN
ncbi:MAG: hypothetical protein SF339_08355 [Blastocatellia bacterium]|nr:hypothetical protein [Blastocatellia bacterium]